MNVARTTQLAWFGSLTLAFSVLSPSSLALAGEAIASDSEVSTAFFISDNTSSLPPSLPSFVEPSAEGSVAFIEDKPARTKQAPVGGSAVARSTTIRSTINRAHAKQATVKLLPAVLDESSPQVVSRPQAARGDLTIVANPQQNRFAVQAVAAQVERDQPGDIQIAVHNEAISEESDIDGETLVEAIVETVAPKNVVPKMVAPKNAAVAAELDTVAELLVTAHQISLEAKTEADYSQIAESCAEAIRQKATGEQRSFARQLSSWALNRRGQLRSDEGKQELADADFVAAITFHPRNWRAIHNRGVSFAQTGNFAEAFDDFSAVIQINPKYAKAYANRATLYVQAKDLQSAIADYEQAILTDSEFASAYVGLGRVCHMLGRLDDAVEHLSAAIELEPTSANIICSRGDLQADRGHYGEALADYARTLELDHEFAHAYRNGAWLLATCPDEHYRDPENAVQGARQALEYSYGERHVALDTLAAAQASNGQFEEAVATVTQAVDLAPEDAKSTYLSRLQLYQNNEPFLTAPVGEVSQVVYEASDQ